MRPVLRLISLGFALFAGACAPSLESEPAVSPRVPSSTGVETALRARAVAFSAAVVKASASAWSKSDVDALADFYTENTIIFSPRGEPIRGRDAVRTYWSRSPSRRILAHTVRPERIDVSSDLVAEHGRFELTWQNDEAPAQSGSSTYVSVWKREPDGVWRKHLDSWW